MKSSHSTSLKQESGKRGLACPGFGKKGQESWILCGWWREGNTKMWGSAKGRYGQISREVKSCYNSWSGSCLLPMLIFSYPCCRSSIPTVLSLYIYTYVRVYPRSLSESLTQLFHCNWRHCPLLLCHLFSHMQVNMPSWLGWIDFETHYVFL